MKRLLCIVGSMDAGGAETYLMKIYRKLDREKYQMDFCVASTNKGFYEDEITSLGGKIYRITNKSKNMIKNFIDIKKIVKQNSYKYVLRISQHSLSALELLAARLGGARVLAFRSSNTHSGGGKLNMIIHYLFRPFANMISNLKIAPSTEAAQFMFGTNIVKRNKFVLLPNGLDLEKFKFSEENRAKIRSELKLKDEFVIGHVGRFTEQKNHKFLLDVFKRYLEHNKNAVLLLVGKGELESQIREYAKELEIIDKIIFYGVSDKVNEIYSAMDIYVFPSLFEGMPNTVIETQASGLKCIISDAITKEANITGMVEYISLQKDADFWANIVLNNIEYLRADKSRDIIKMGYDINGVVKRFEKIIFENLNTDRKDRHKTIKAEN